MTIPKGSIVKILPFVLFGTMLLQSGCRPKSPMRDHQAAPVCTSYAMIRLVVDSGGVRLAELDTLQKQSAKPGEAAPEYMNAVPGFTRWTIAPDAHLILHTFSYDSAGNFNFNQTVEYDTLRRLFAKGSSTRFSLVPFKIIHSGTTISSISEEYLP